jgi:hypothetical protein
MSATASPALIIKETHTLGKDILGTVTFNTKNSRANLTKTMSLKLIYKSGEGEKNPTSELINFIINLYKIKKLYICKSNEDAFFCIDDNDGNIRDNTLTDFLDIKEIKDIKFVTNTRQEECTFKIISNDSIFKDYSYRHEIYNGKPLIEYYNLLEKEIQLPVQNGPELKPYYNPVFDTYDFTNWPKSGGGRSKKTGRDGRLAITLGENLLSNKIKTKEYKKVMNLFKKYISDPHNDNSNPEYNIMPHKDGLKHVNYFGLPLLHAYIKRYETMNDLLPSKIKNKIMESLKSLENNREFKGGWGPTIMEPPVVPTHSMQQYMQPQMQSGMQRGETLVFPNPQNMGMGPQQMGQPMGYPMGQPMPPMQMPPMGQPMPPMQMPPMGQQMHPMQMPPMGYPMPPMGQQMPPMGQPMPPMGQPMPPMGYPMPPQMHPTGPPTMSEPMHYPMSYPIPTPQYINNSPIQVSSSRPSQFSSQPSQPSQFSSQPLQPLPQLQAPTQPFPQPSQLTTMNQNIKDVYRLAWIIKDSALYRFNGFFYMKYDNGSDSGNSGNSGGTMNSFRILCLNDYHKNRIGKNKDKNIPHTLIVANKITNVSKIYLCDKENLYKNIRRQSNNSIIAEILNETEQIYIFFEDKLHNVTEINLEPKYKNDFELLNYEIKKVVEEYKAITINSNIKEMFELYSKLEEQLENIRNSNKDIDTVIRLYKEELETRAKICDIMLKNKNGTINEKIDHYRIMLRNTIVGIKSLSESDQRAFVNLLQKYSADLIKNIELYGKYFIYLNEKTKKPSYFFGR